MSVKVKGEVKKNSVEGGCGSWFNPEVSEVEKGDYLLLARQLCYPQEVLDAINNAKTDFECERILKRARRTY